MSLYFVSLIFVFNLFTSQDLKEIQRKYDPWLPYVVRLCSAWKRTGQCFNHNKIVTNGSFVSPNLKIHNSDLVHKGDEIFKRRALTMISMMESMPKNEYENAIEA